MEIARSVTEARAWRRCVDSARVALVPTMGYLHDGHLSLVERARALAPVVAASIFVNPAQFAANEDLSRYPRDPERDLAKLKAAGVACVYMPDVEDVYPPGFASAVDVGPIATKLEGKFRPGHFRGVATVVCKLFGVMQPDVAIFGQKDAQQLLVIRRMTADLNLPVEIVAGPTVREPDGLAMSSRNVYLSPDERRQAPSLSNALSLARGRFEQGERRTRPIKLAMRRLIQSEPDTRIDYVSIADGATLDELTVIDRPALVSLAVRVGSTRLIDNTTLEP